MHETPRRDEISDRLASDRPREPVAYLVLVREHRRTNAQHHELFQRGVLRRLPWLAPDLIPARENARVAVPALAVLHRHAPRDDRAVALEAFTHLAQRRGGEAELGLEILHRAGAGAGQMPHQTRGVVVARLRLRQRGTAQRVRSARAFGREEQRLPAMELRLEDVGALGELAAPAPLRLGPRREALLRRVVGLLVRRREQAGQR